MRLSNLRIEDYVDNYGDERSRLICDVSDCKCSKSTSAWIGVQKKYKSWLCADVYDAFMIGFLFPAMYYKEDLVIDGPVTRQLYLNTMNKYIHISCAFNPTISPCIIKAKELVNITKTSSLADDNHVGVGFGGGVDSFFTLYNNFFNPIDDENKIDTLMFLHVDNYGDPREFESWERARKYYEAVENLAGELHINALMTTTNLYEFNPPYPHGATKREFTYSLDGFRQRIASVLSLQNGLKQYYFSTSSTYRENLVSHGKMWAAGVLWQDEWCESFALPALCTPKIELVSYGGYATRTQKIETIIDNPYVKKYLITCNGSYNSVGKNCCSCHKCKRMMLTLDMMGKLDEYKQVYDSDHFKKHIYNYKCSIVIDQKKTGDLMSDDLLALAKRYNYQMPSYIEAKLYMITRDLWHCLLGIKRLFKK